LDVISKREKTGYDAIYFVNNFIKYAKDIDLNYEELIYKIINKDLKINVGVALINRAVPQTIKQFEVALAETFNFANESRTHKIDFSKKNYSIMQKLDGCRCIAIHNDFGINFYSRKGKMFHTVEALKTDIEKADIKNKYVLDGELCVIDENGLENFQSIMKQIARKNYQIKEFVFVVFDMIKYEDFNATVSDETYSSRFNKLADLVNKNKFNHIKLIRHKLNGSDQDFTQ
jgi:ATP-dependent DNA ligase